MKISELKENMAIEMLMLVSQAESGVTNSGAPYLSIVFKDNTGSIEGKLWDVKPEQREIVKVGKIISVRADVISYRKSTQLKVTGVSAVDSDNISLEDFVPSGPVPADELRSIISGAIDSIDDFEIKAIVSAIYRKHDRQIFASPAASRNHHEYYGGLATHVSEMINIAYALCRLYPTLNRDLLLAGILLHDVGKIEELRSGAVTEYTLEGKLLGHISISQTMVQETADELGIKGEKVLLLRHMILAHHGKQEFGSPVLPQIMEAEVLHMIDDMDAKMTMIQKELDKIGPGEFSAKIFTLDNRSFYKPKQ